MQGEGEHGEERRGAEFGVQGEREEEKGEQCVSSLS